MPNSLRDVMYRKFSIDSAVLEINKPNWIGENANRNLKKYQPS